MTPQKLERVLRSFFEFKALYENTGIDEITIDGGIVVNIHDVLRGIESLPKQQRNAVVLLCLLGMKEKDAAPKMGIMGRPSPVGVYKRLGLQRIVKMYWSPGEDDEVESHQRTSERLPPSSGPQRSPRLSSSSSPLG